MSTIKPIDIVEWRDEMTANGKAPATIRNQLSVVSQAYRIAATEWGMINLRNPVTNVRMPRNRPSRDRRLQGDEYDHLLEAAQNDCNPYVAPAFKLAVHTAMRQGELLGIEWKHVNLEQRFITLPQMLTKTNRSRSIPLSSIASQTLREIRKDDGQVIPLKKTTLNKAWNRILRMCCISNLTWHDLRHQATSLLFEKGLTAEEVMSITGHTTYAMLARYTHIRAQDLAARLG